MHGSRNAARPSTTAVETGAEPSLGFHAACAAAALAYRQSSMTAADNGDFAGVTAAGAARSCHDKKDHASGVNNRKIFSRRAWKIFMFGD